MALIAVACLYFGKDGAIISTIIGMIAGGLGWGVKEIKDKISPGTVQLPVPQVENKGNTFNI